MGHDSNYGDDENCHLLLYFWTGLDRTGPQVTSDVIDAKCQFFGTEQNLQTKFYPKILPWATSDVSNSTADVASAPAATLSHQDCAVSVDHLGNKLSQIIIKLLRLVITKFSTFW